MVCREHILTNLHQQGRQGTTEEALAMGQLFRGMLCQNLQSFTAPYSKHNESSNTQLQGVRVCTYSVGTTSQRTAFGISAENIHGTQAQVYPWETARHCQGMHLLLQIISDMPFVSTEGQRGVQGCWAFSSQHQDVSGLLSLGSVTSRLL